MYWLRRAVGVWEALYWRRLSNHQRSMVFWTRQGATIAANAASLALQARCSFRLVGQRRRIARRDGIWHDTVVTERRSEIVGVD
jgi:L-amino acid N-acyltransferase YncA